MMAPRKPRRRADDPSATAFARDASVVTDRPVVPPPTGRRIPGWGASRVAHVPAARGDAEEVLLAFGACLKALQTSLGALSALRRPRLLGKVDDELARLARVSQLLDDARSGLDAGDLGACGRAVREAERELSTVGSALAVALRGELGRIALSSHARDQMAASAQRRASTQEAVQQARRTSRRSGVLATLELHRLVADEFNLAAEVLTAQGAPTSKAQLSASQGSAVVAPEELETLADVGGLEEVKERLRRTVGSMLDRTGAKPGIAPNGILLYGPPGTGKSLLARAVAGEYGLKFLRFSPGAIASPYQHEPAAKLRELFALGASQAPCLLFLDEVDAIAGRRDANPSADQRELVTQLLDCLEQYRDRPGLVIAAATNSPDHLDPAFREGRFDVRLAVPLPDEEARAHIFEVQLEAQGVEVDWDSIDLEDLARRSAGRSGAALASVVGGAAARSGGKGEPLSHMAFVAEIDARSGQDRPQTLEDRISWDEVVLPDDVRQRLAEILVVFERPELGRQLGVAAPAGVILYGPPGTGKTTIARAMASQAKSSFYELSAADLLSKWVGESEQRIAQIFTRARANRPAIIFCDEIDSVLRRRTAGSSTPWEERVVSQFLRELDGLHSGEGVLLVGATNRLDIIDEAARSRRLVPIEVGLPDVAGRRRLLELLCSGTCLEASVDLDEVAAVTEGMSGAALKALRNAAGLRALTRATTAAPGEDVAVARDDFAAALAEAGAALPARRRRRASTAKAVEVRAPRERAAGLEKRPKP